MPFRIALMGITGGIGRAFAEQALAAGHEIVGIARNPAAVTLAHDRLKVVKGAAGDVAAVTAALAGCNVAVSAVGSGAGIAEARKPTTVYSSTAETLLAGMKANGVERFVGVTAGGIVPSPDWPFFYKHVIHKLLRNMYIDMEQMEREVRRTPGVRHLFVRPPMLTDGPRTGVYRVRAEIMPPHAQKLSRADVADYMLRRIDADDYRAEAMALGY